MSRILTILGLVALAGYTAATALTQVEPGERAVVRRFGRILPHQPGPGLYVGWPWGIDRVERIPVEKVRSVGVGYSGKESEDGVGTPSGQLLTGDHNLVNIQAEIHYTINDAEVEKYFLQADQADALLARVAESALAEWVAGRNVDEVLLEGKPRLPAVLVQETQARLQQYDLGITITAASIVRLTPPDEVKDAFDRVGKAQTARDTRRNLALETANSRLRDAEAEIYKSQRLTAAYAREQQLQAEADAESFTKRLTQYRQLSSNNPRYLNQLWLDEMTRLYAQMRTAGRIDLLDHHLTGDGLNIVQFPLPKKR